MLSEIETPLGEGNIFLDLKFSWQLWTEEEKMKSFNKQVNIEQNWRSPYYRICDSQSKSFLDIQ